MGKRVTVIFILFFLLFGFIVVKLFILQVVSFEGLSGLAEKQRMASLPIIASRGKILASDGSPLVLNKKTYGIFLEPKSIKDKDIVLNILAKELDISISTISSKLNNDSLLWLPVIHQMEEKKKEIIASYKLDGVGFMDETKRYYPEASMAAQLLGFVGKGVSGEDQGYFGVEGYYDQQLRGRDGRLIQELDPVGNPILTAERQNIPAENGRDLKLYLDKTIQFIAERQLRKGIEIYGAKGGTVTILDPKTGGILAMASLPSYNPDGFYNYQQELYKNPIVSSSYEPGSTFKVLIMGAALNEGKIKSDTIIDEAGPVEIGGYTINTWNQKYHGRISATEVLNYSSNVGMVNIEKNLDQNILLSYIGNYGFGNLTGIDLQEETSPDIRERNKWYEIDYATVSFGQGIAVTPIQMVRAVSAVANKGKMMEPHIVKEIKLADGSNILIKPKVMKQVFKPEVASVLTEMMVSAVDNGETKVIKPTGFRIAGKTGTAQIPIAGHYDSQKTITSFVGFAPVENPAFVMLVTLREPTSSPWGSETAAPIFFAIAKELFSYMGISPSG
ncbi:penicillin-binding protein 2 [Candidatus Gottesmanbacteria bacterium]|nr:penicillin-binding protein 2 [Candidatus Gottesmanbacteria bacterium]